MCKRLKNGHRTRRPCRHVPGHASLKRPLAACQWWQRLWAGFQRRSKWVSRDILRSPNDEAMAARIMRLLEDDGLRARVGVQAAEDAWKKFDLNRQVEEYLDWYGKIIDECA